MGCVISTQKNNKIDIKNVPVENIVQHVNRAEKFLHSSIIIQKFFRRYKARLEIRRRCAWKIFQEIEYTEEQDQINLYNFFTGFVSNLDQNNNGSVHSLPSLFNKSNVLPTDLAQFYAELVEDINSTIVEETYEGPHVSLPITLTSLHEIIEHVKSGNILHAKYVKIILHEAKLKLQLLPNVLSANLNMLKRITIVGDLHGKLDNLLTIFHKNGLPSADNPYIFNGDFVDRGKNSIEIVVLLCCFFLLYPGQVFINRGNHEDYLMNSRYGFSKELTNKYKASAGKVKEVCWELFAWLPLATLVNNKIFVTHGGLSDRTDFETIMNIRRNLFISILKPAHVVFDEENLPPVEVIQEWEQILDLLWSDPQSKPGKVFNKHRGGGCCFGPDITKSVLEKHEWDLLIRSHECKFEGYEYTHNNRVLTIFSASSYYTDSSNLGAYVKLDVDLAPRIIQYIVSNENHFNKSVGCNEESAMKELREKIYAFKDHLIKQFRKKDENQNGLLTVSEWSSSMEEVLQLKLPWKLIRPKLVETDSNGMVLYMTCLESYRIKSNLPQHELLSETIYRNKQTLETVFRIIDKDGSGLISSEEFEAACHILNNYTNGLIPITRIQELAKTLDINKDGMIDFNEFLEAFRLVSNDCQQEP